MNPHDHTQRPGSHLVFEKLSINDPESLVTLHPHRSPLAGLGTVIADAARDVDGLHETLGVLARGATQVLERVARGEDADLRFTEGIVRSSGARIELLAARRGEAYQHLERAVHAYDRTRAAQVAPAPALGQRQDLAAAPVAGQDGGSAVSIDRLPQALRAVDPGSSTSLHRTGQLLPLTANGEAALQTAHSAEPRVSAALHRSQPAPSASPPAAAAAAPMPAPAHTRSL